ncbi:MAG: hypothetical protein OMM_05681 [Candidatus Magnetoglobus multicellularis str. Araruama]|uniref:Uncharacterized protein n=1 Tax=Candidatus Magnetoglobus multicellularis str. Araruama TaxID=890399 RepID=A0A1V1NUV4_9BACT|nr:MAG: hypothetical protein OMM_05681 [Candidatus Magnetoglobus multicellularis str. Araruama]
MVYTYLLYIQYIISLIEKRNIELETIFEIIAELKQHSIFKFFDKLAPVLVPTLCVGTYLGRSASPALMFQMYKTQDAERPGCIPTQSVGTRTGSYQVKNLNIE